MFCTICIHCSQRIVCFQGGEIIIAKGELTTVGVHKQYGISLRTPPYINRDISEPVKCSMFIHKPKSGESSEPVDFYYLPAQAGMTARTPPALDGVNAINPADIKPVKRGRTPMKTDDPSSGQVSCLLSQLNEPNVYVV